MQNAFSLNQVAIQVNCLRLNWFAVRFSQIQQNDGMPELLCKKCYARLRMAYDFKKQVHESDHHLRTFISDVNQKFQQVTGVGPKKEVIDDELHIDSELLVFDEIGDGCEIINDESLNNPIDILDHQTINTANDNDDILPDEDTTDLNYGDEPEQMEVLIINEDGADMSAYTVEKLDDEDEQPSYGHNDDSLNEELNDAEQMFEEEEHLDDTVRDIEMDIFMKIFHLISVTFLSSLL